MMETLKIILIGQVGAYKRIQRVQHFTLGSKS